MRYCPECNYPKEHHSLQRIPSNGGFVRVRQCLLIPATLTDSKGEPRRLPTVTADRAAYADMAAL